jgi:hypothetical protein
VPAHLGGAGEREDVDVGVQPQRAPGDHAGAVDHVEDSRRDAGLEGELRDAQRRQR